MPALRASPYRVDVIGFSAAERAMLANVFELSGRRASAFVQHEPASPEAPHVFLVDADDAVAFEEFRNLHRCSNLPAVLVGAVQRPEGMVVIGRPVPWAHLIHVLEAALEAGPSRGGPLTSPPAGSAKVMPHARPAHRPWRPHVGAIGEGGSARASVLVVDDNAVARKFMRAKLTALGCEVDLARSGEQAISLIGRRAYDCVCLDVVLPGVDGYQVCKLIKSARQPAVRPVVVMLTSRSSPLDKLRGSLAGCDAYLTKPLDEERLRQVIENLLPGLRRRRAGQGSR